MLTTFCRDFVSKPMTLPEIDHVIYVVAHAYTFFTSEQYSFGLPLLITCVLTFFPSYSDHVCSDHLSSETYTEHRVGAKAFGPSIIVVAFGYY